MRNVLFFKDFLARSEGFEPPTNWFEASYSIQLSYERFGKSSALLPNF